jgi:hypothetical protein
MPLVRKLVEFHSNISVRKNDLVFPLAHLYFCNGATKLNKRFCIIQNFVTLPIKSRLAHNVAHGNSSKRFCCRKDI